MKLALVLMALLLIGSAEARPLPEPDVEAGDCHAWAEPHARFGPQVKAVCQTPVGECYLRVGPGPNDTPAVSHGCR